MTTTSKGVLHGAGTSLTKSLIFTAIIFTVSLQVFYLVGRPVVAWSNSHAQMGDLVPLPVGMLVFWSVSPTRAFMVAYYGAFTFSIFAATLWMLHMLLGCIAFVAGWEPQGRVSRALLPAAVFESSDPARRALKRMQQQYREREEAKALRKRERQHVREEVSGEIEQLKAQQAGLRSQLQQAHAKGSRLERELVEARAETARLSTASGSSQGLIQHATEEPEGAVVLGAVDEAQHETAEHQALVIRQLRVALRHAVEVDRAGDLSEVEAALAAGPRRLADLADWAAENADRVIVLKRAINCAKKASYHDEPFVFQALDVLATTYRDVKLGLLDRMALKEACDRLGLDIGKSMEVAPSEDYFFSWRKRRCYLDMHIGRGNSRDPFYCFRAYFTWDEEEGKVIIGWTPTHLPTRTT